MIRSKMETSIFSDSREVYCRIYTLSLSADYYSKQLGARGTDGFNKSKYAKSDIRKDKEFLLSLGTKLAKLAEFSIINLEEKVKIVNTLSSLSSSVQLRSNEGKLLVVQISIEFSE